MLEMISHSCDVTGRTARLFQMYTASPALMMERSSGVKNTLDAVSEWPMKTYYRNICFADLHMLLKQFAFTYNICL